MTAAARVSEAPRPDPVAVFTARCEARATLWQAGEIELYDAVDALQAAAVRDGLVAELGQDEVQRLMAEAFHAVRDDQDASSGALISADDAWSAPGWRDAALEYHQKRGASALIVEPEPECLTRARRLMADDVTLERAHAEVSKPSGVAASTLRAAKYLVRENNPEQLQRWLDQHSAQEREAILRHFEQRKRMQPA